MDFAPAYFPSFPVPAEKETIFSLFTRCKARSGFSDVLILSELTGQKFSRTLLGPLPAYLPLISGKLHDNHPGKDPYYLIRNHSMFPYFSYFMPSSIREELETKVATSNITRQISLSMGLIKYPTKILFQPRFCLSCLKEAVEREGFPFYRVEHQLPGVFVCHKHAETLYNGCKQCGTYPITNCSLSMAGHCRCESGIEPLPVTKLNDNAVQSLLWLAEQSAFLLGKAGTNASDPGERIRGRVLSKLTDKSKYIDYMDTARKITDFFGIETLRLLNIEVFSGNAPAPWIPSFFRNVERTRPTILYLLLIGAYFQSVEEFEQSSDERTLACSGHSTKSYTQETLQKHKVILERLITENPDICRGDVQNVAPGTYDFLVRHQKHYFQSRVKRASGKPVPRKSRIDWVALDKIKAEELKGIFKTEFAKESKPTYITQTSALKTCNIFAKYRVKPDKFPEVSKVLSANLENRDNFSKRRLRWAIVQMTAERIPISMNTLRRTSDLVLEVVISHRDFILSTTKEVGGVIANRSTLL